MNACGDPDNCDDSDAGTDEDRAKRAKRAEARAAKKTKRVDGEDLTSSAFAYVGDAAKTATWKLPIKFSTEEKSKSHIQNALSRIDQTQGIPEGEKAEVKAKIVAAAKEHGIHVSGDDSETKSEVMNIELAKARTRMAEISL
jgi:hypothetical protein